MNERLRTIALITVWSGPLPNYVPLFLMTAGRNPSIDFLFVADQPAPPLTPTNVRWVQRSFDDLLALVADRLGIPLSNRQPYKLVDYKPAFGVMFADELRDADFWGHVDCDIVLGDIRSFVTTDALDQHDVLVFRGRGFVHGPLTLYRNSHPVNRLFERAPDWVETFTDREPRSFTEHAHRRRITGTAMAPTVRRARSQRVSMTDVVFHAAAVGHLRVFDEDLVVETDPSRLPLRMEYRDGALFDQAPLREHYRNRALVLRPQVGEREVMFFHLLSAKRRPGFDIPAWTELPDRFRIIGSGITQDPPPPLEQVTAIGRCLPQLTADRLAWTYRRLRRRAGELLRRTSLRGGMQIDGSKKYYLCRALDKVGLLPHLNLALSSSVGDRRWTIPVHGVAGYRNLRPPTEPWMTGLLERLLAEQPRVFVDVGMNLGQTFIKTFSIYDDVRYVGFEPNPLCFRYCMHLARSNGIDSSLLCPIGLSDSTGILTLHGDSEHAAGASLVPGFRRTGRQKEIGRIPVMRGDDVLSADLVEHISLLKLDIEGGELEALCGLRSTIERTRPAILLEILPVYSLDGEAGRTRKDRQDQVLALLAGLGYAAFLVDERSGGLVPIDDIPVHGDMTRTNYLFVTAESEPLVADRIQAPSR
jgi:FkbM family methyltransferase